LKSLKGCDLGENGKIMLQFIFKMGYDCVDWIHLFQNMGKWWALVNKIMNIMIPQKAVNFFTICMTVSFSRRTPLHGKKKLNLCQYEETPHLSRIKIFWASRFNQHIHSIKQCVHSLHETVCSDGLEILCAYGCQRFITMSTKLCCWTISWASSIQSIFFCTLFI
jgi:hypothetical protein